MDIYIYIMCVCESFNKFYHVLSEGNMMINLKDLKVRNQNLDLFTSLAGMDSSGLGRA